MLELLNHPWLGYLIGITFAYFIYLKQKKEARPTYQFDSRKLINIEEQELPYEVEVYFKSQPIRELTRSRFYFWNSGKAPILKKHLAPVDSTINLKIEDGIFLDWKIVKRTNEANNFLPDIDSQQKIKITFDYLNQNDGAVIDIFHTSSKKNPKVVENLVGIKKIIYSPYQKDSNKMKIKMFFDAILSVGPVILLMIIGMISISLDSLIKRKIVFKLIIFIITLLFSTIMAMKINFLVTNVQSRFKIKID